MAETAIAIGLLVMILGGLSAMVRQSGRLNHYYLVKQRCMAAGQAQLDGIAATGREIPEEDFQRLWPGLSVSVHQSPGKGDWVGLRLLKVTVSGQSRGKTVAVTSCRYLPAAKIKRAP